MKPPLVLALLTTAALAADPAELGIFGIGSCHVNGRSANDATRWIPQMREIGLRYYRACPTTWPQVQPAPGGFRWDALDSHMAYLADHGFIFGGLLHANVGWNAKDAPGTLPVRNLDAWGAYVAATVGHCKDRIRRWEVWNEPPNGTGPDQTPADYAKLVVRTYQEAKAADPDCRIGLAAKSAHISYLERAIRAGAKDHFDYITLHPYEILDGIAENTGSESVYLNIVPTVRKMLAACNPAKKDVPVVFTELGCDSRKGEDTQAHALIKAYTMGIAQGVACIQWFEGRDGDSGPLGLLDGRGNPRPAYHALGRMIEHLGQRPVYRGWVMLDGRHPAFLFDGAKGPLLIAWARNGKHDVRFETALRVLDLTDGTEQTADTTSLGVAPLLVFDPPGKLAGRAVNDRPLPWDGDFSKAESVSLTVGDGQAERGLHTRSGAAAAKAVVAYGGSARAGDIPGGNLFVVDPAFLSYDRVPIEITAEVRRKEDNKNAGFKLVYESPEGFKTAGHWYTIPDNERWHTATWRIEDPCFVNYWGYNFALVSDGDEFNQYYLRRVTVRKAGD